jgi:Cu+-exporting ATPase
MKEPEISLKVEGMTCNNCAAGISKSLRKAGFSDADANFADGEVTFSLVEGRSAQEAIENIEGLGYKVQADASEVDKGLSSIEKKFIFALIFTLPLFAHMFVPKDWFLNDPLVQIGLCLPVYLLGAFHFGKSAWGSLKAGMANMDVLIFIGTTAAFAYSLAGTLMYWGTHAVHDYMFFETAATIITLVLLGNVIEHRAVRQTSRRIGELTKLQSTKAKIVLRLNGKEKIFEADAGAVKAGDEVQVNEGDHFPVDGTILTGEGLVDESALTGESEPVLKKPGDPVSSGTTLISGNVRITTLRPAKDSTLEKIISLVKKARREQPDIQLLGDRVSAIFVPVVLIIAALTFVIAHFLVDLSVTQALMNSIAVLVISCPCAMGLATPTAVVAGVGRAAKHGIMIKGGNTLERYARAKTIIFDKTGTLTSGEFRLQELQNELGSRAGALIHARESRSSHPIARSLSRVFSDGASEVVEEIREIKGEGMEGRTSRGEKVFFGKNTTAEKGDLVLTLNEKPVGFWNIEDELKPGSKEMVKTFQEEGFRIILLSGDRREKVLKTAEYLGIKEAEYEKHPDEKLRFIEALSKETNVIMVGDGINDGPSLSRADVGISPGGASALAIDSARIVIMNPDEMKALAQSYKISRATYTTIKQNLFWAFFYNVIAIPIAAVGLLNPMIAALSMAFSDVVVIGNSLRLRSRKFD